MKNFIVILILLAIASAIIITAFILIKNKIVLNDMIKHFKKCNVVVDGKKGTGKGMVFNYVINKRKNEDYYGNVDYGHNYHHVDVKDISISPNTYENFIDGKVVQVQRLFKEKSDIYIDDGGVYLPSYMDSKLYKSYPSFPLFYALSRHYGDLNIHVNVQNVDRLWKAIREQADFFVHTKKTIKIGSIFITFITTYDKLESARQSLSPLKSRIMNQFSKAESDKYQAEHGNIKNAFIIQFKKQLHYKDRAFEKLICKGRRLNHCYSDKKFKLLSRAH